MSEQPIANCPILGIQHHRTLLITVEFVRIIYATYLERAEFYERRSGVTRLEENFLECFIEYQRKLSIEPLSNFVKYCLPYIKRSLI